MSERRRATRQKSFLRGNIQFNNGMNVVDCLVRDISQAGARLIFSGAVTTPDVFDLHIPQRKQMFRAHVQWRQDDEVGVAFTAAEGAGKPDGELAERVRKLEGEIAALRRMMEKLRGEVMPLRDGFDAA
jgi:hypothetical protein